MEYITVNKTSQEKRDAHHISHLFVEDKKKIDVQDEDS